MQAKNKFKSFLNTSAIIIIAIIFLLIFFSISIWVGVAVVVAMSLICLLLYGIFAGMNAQEKDTKDRYGNFEPYLREGETLSEGDFIRYYKCKPCMSMVKDATSFKTLGFHIPSYQIVESFGMPPNFNGDFTETVKLKFDIPLEESVLFQIKNMTENPETNWSVENDRFLLTVNDIDLENKKDFWYKIFVSSAGMEISQGRV